MRRGIWCSPPHFFCPEENVVKAGVETVPTVFEDIITRMAKLTEEEIRAIREGNDAHYIARPNRRDCVSHRLRVDTLRSMVRQEITGNYRHMMGPVQFSEDSLWNYIREEVRLQKEQLKNMGDEHKETVDSNHLLMLMSKHKELVAAFHKISNSSELLALLEDIIDATGVTDTKVILKSLEMLKKHERKS